MPRRFFAPGSFPLAHWRGDLSLRVSFWLNFALPTVATNLVFGGLAAWMSLEGRSLQASSMALLVGWPLGLALAVWGAVGAWRAAHARDGDAILWSVAAKFALALGVLSTLASATLDFGFRFGESLQLAQGIDPLGAIRIIPAPDGRRLRLQGPLGMGDATRVQHQLEAAPQVELIELDSSGGRLYEAQAIAHAATDRGLRTRVVGQCDNACTLIFLAGKSRQIMPGAQLGLQRLSVAGFHPVLGWLANRELAAIYGRAGLPENFLIKTMSTPPPNLWHPEADELIAARMIGVPNRPLDIDLPTFRAALPDDYAEALSTNPVWQALDRRHPGSIAAAAGRMAAARASGATDDAVQVAGQRVIEELLSALLSHASAPMRENFVVLLSDQLDALGATSPQACLALLTGDAAVRRGLPTALVVRESEWLSDTATEPAPDAARRPTELETEVIRRSLGERAPLLLAGLRRPARADTQGRDCALAAALVGAVKNMPPAERRLALRMMFGSL